MSAVSRPTGKDRYAPLDEPDAVRALKLSRWMAVRRARAVDRDEPRFGISLRVEDSEVIQAGLELLARLPDDRVTSLVAAIAEYEDGQP